MGNEVRKSNEFSSKHEMNLENGNSSFPFQSSQAFVLQMAGEFTFEERRTPASYSSREILVRIIATGVCGSDVSRFTKRSDMTVDFSLTMLTYQ